MQVVFRVDASNRIGSGHVMRCVALAEALRERKATVAFICRPSVGNLIKWLETSKGFKVHALDVVSESDATKDHLSGIDHQVDAVLVAGILSQMDPRIDWLILDHYGLDYRWEKAVRPYTERLMVLDDLADREHDCDLLLDQNFSLEHNRYKNLVPETCQQLLGPRYAILRQEFSEGRKKTERKSQFNNRGLVSFGGSDPTNETAKTIAAISKTRSRKIAFDIVIGANYAYPDQVKQSLDSLPNVTPHFQTDRMAELMTEADFAIGSGGITMWERACLGLPSLVITVAENQVPSTRDLAKENLILWLGNSEDVTSDAIATHIDCLLSNRSLLKSLSSRSSSLTDGRGIQRVMNRLVKREIQLRKATEQDCQAVFNWRNNEEVRKHSLDAAEIKWEDHVKWFRSAISSDDRALLIGEDNHDPIGVVRFDLLGKTAEISIYLIPGNSGLGLGTELLVKSRQWIELNFPQITKLQARILPENSRSKHAFLNAGFQEEASLFSVSVG